MRHTLAVKDVLIGDKPCMWNDIVTTGRHKHVESDDFVTFIVTVMSL